MSSKVYGNFNPEVTVINGSALVTEVPVDISSYKNRKTKASTLKSYLKARGGKFDRGLWQPPLVAELPDKTRYLFDGDHRRALWINAYPEKDTMPAQIVPVNDRAEISRLFVAINKTARKALTANEVFVHEAFGGNEEAKKTEKHLLECSLKVSLGTGEPGHQIGNPGDPEVSVKGFKKAIKENSVLTVKSASNTIQNLWPNDRSVRVELLHGLAKVYKHTPINAKHAKDFQDFLCVRKAADSTQGEVATSFKQEGGNRHNYHEACIALGIMLKFKKWSVQNRRMATKTFNKYYGSFIKELETQIYN